MRTLAAVTLTLLVGAALAGAAYWGFLSTPESTVWTLGLSAVLAAATFVVAVVSTNLALLLWSAGTWREPGAAASRDALARAAVRGVPACIPALILLGAAWWLTSTVDRWVQTNGGEISAWFIATLGWADVRWMFTSVAWLTAWLFAVAAPLAGLAWWDAALRGHWLPTRAVMRQALNFKALAIATALVGLLVWMPWTYLVPWRPSGLPRGGSGELAFVAIKLGLTALLMAVGSALVLRTAAARPAPLTE